MNVKLFFEKQLEYIKISNFIKPLFGCYDMNSFIAAKVKIVHSEA